ncbi:HesA/MoeB/ThiF family protein [Lactobacillus sp. CC-MHH1034]|uniref:HesA/MoeB/ThiF family protein n=1 Tax=Agrilactobacillus fermenti TaxID=2586909 RepID=UPI001E5A1197|nr:HesA/MoeB/ThiF family protein [Agrilactobacillus fermenti]MCD2255674.1 HesA/MoeB/ThiF family protein [Agrilactobacillus fermenti]
MSVVNGFTVNRYDRQERVRQIGPAGQHQLNQAHVLIVGAGALGSYCAELLTRAGVGRLDIFDPDTVSLTNLQRQTIFTEQDAQQDTFKVDALQKNLIKINHHVIVHGHPYELSESRLRTLDKFDLAIDCTDNFAARELLNQLALKYKFNYIFGSCAGVSGQVMAIDPQTGPCLACLFPNLQALKQTDCDLLGVNTALIPIVSGLQVSLAIKLLIAPDQMAFNQLITINNWTLKQDTFTILKNPQCPVCQRPVTEVAADFKNELHVLCGTNVYAIYLPETISVSVLKQYLTAQKIPQQANPLGVQFKWQALAMTFFKNHKLMIYDAPTKTVAQTAYQQLTQVLDQPQLKLETQS